MGGNKEKGISENGEIEKIVIGHCMKKKDKRGNFAPLFQHSRYYAYCLSRNIVVLLILAGITINLVLSDDGIFKKAEEASEKYNQIVDGYIFKVDRTIPKIIEYVGPAEGIIITASISGNNGWVKPSETNISVRGKIITYSGGSITKATVSKEGGTQTDLILTDNNYIIENITENTTMVIQAEDSSGNTKTKTIPIELKIDETAPTIDEITVEAKAMTIKISATGNDKNINGQEESGINYFTYSITSTEDKELNGIPENKRTGTFKLNEKIEIEALSISREETAYTISIIAQDNVNNQSAPQSKTIKVEEGRSRKAYKNKARGIKKS